MHRKHSLYTAFRKDIQRLIDSNGPNEYINQLLLCVKHDKGLTRWRNEKRLVDRIDDRLNENQLWRSIKTAYKLR